MISYLFKIHFADGKCVDIDVNEIGGDGMGGNLDRLVVIHGNIVGIDAFKPEGGMAIVIR